MTTEKIAETLDRIENNYLKGLLTPWEYVLGRLRVRGVITAEEYAEGCEFISNNLKKDETGLYE